MENEDEHFNDRYILKQLNPKIKIMLLLRPFYEHVMEIVFLADIQQQVATTSEEHMLSENHYKNFTVDKRTNH